MKLLSLLPRGLAVSPRVGLLADSVNDASSTHKVYLLAAALAALGVALILLTVWFWRSTRHDPELLAPLEVIGGRRFRRLDGGAQQAALDNSRPEAAEPMKWGVRRGSASGEREIDLRASLSSGLVGFEDLHDPALIAVATAESNDSAKTATSSASAPAAPAPVMPVAASMVDIDSALASVGASVDPSAVGASPRPSAAGSATVIDDGSASAAAAGPQSAASGSAAAASVASAAAKPAVLAPRPVVGASSTWDGSAGFAAAAAGREPAAVDPLVIVPVDHEVRSSSLAAEPQRRVTTISTANDEPLEDATSAADVPVEESPAAIDPLLRMVNRGDG